MGVHFGCNMSSRLLFITVSIKRHYIIPPTDTEAQVKQKYKFVKFSRKVPFVQNMPFWHGGLSRTNLG